MQFAHMVGQHAPDSVWNQLGHFVISWAGFAVSVVLGAIICLAVYKRTRKTEVKEEVRRK